MTPLIDTDEFPPPPDLTGFIVREGNQCVGGGCFGDVYRCWCNDADGPKQVAVKAFRVRLASSDKSDKMVHRELGIWRRLKHNSIVPFLGIAYGFGMQDAISLVSLWMPNGTLLSFLEKYDSELGVVHRLQLLLDIADGLHYLHSRHIIHGDLYCNNVLIDADRNARLVDFGFATLVGNVPDSVSYLQRSTMRPGALRWAAPEQVLPQEGFKWTTTCDIYSFGCISLQVLSGKKPWSEIKEDLHIVLKIAQGHTPARPELHPIDDHHWAVIERCWLSPQKRPLAEELVTSIRQFLCYDPAASDELSLGGLADGAVNEESLREEEKAALGNNLMPTTMRSHNPSGQKFPMVSNQQNMFCSGEVAAVNNPLPNLQEPDSPLDRSECSDGVLLAVTPSILSISSTNYDLPTLYPLRTGYANDRLPLMHEDPDSPLDRREYHEVVLPPAMPYPSTPSVNNGLGSWPIPITLQRPHLSEFSKLYNFNITEEEDFDFGTTSEYRIVPAPALSQYTWPLLDARQNAALDYFMKHVLRKQYPHINESDESIIWNLIHTNDDARQAICRLSDLHRTSIQRSALATIEENGESERGMLEGEKKRESARATDLAAADISLIFRLLREKR